MRVLFNALGVVGGGQERRAYEMLARWRTIDRDSELIVLRNAGFLSGAPVGTWISYLDRPYRLGRLNAIDRIAWENLELPRLVRSARADVFLSFSHYLPRAFPASVRSIIGVSNLAPFSAEALEAERTRLAVLRLRILRRTIVRSAQRASYVIALSNMCASVLIAHGVTASKIHVIPNGVAPMRNDHTTRSEKLPNAEFVLCVSNYWRYKNFEVLLRAYALLDAELRARHRLVIIGFPFDQSYAAEIATMCDALRISSCVDLIPGADRDLLAQAYGAASVFVFPSLIENSPNILLEALSAGLPSLISSRDPMPEFAADAAQYFDPLSANELHVKLDSLLRNKHLRAELSRSALERSQLYTWDRFTQQVVTLCRGTA
jgi:hypothetical protein